LLDSFCQVNDHLTIDSSLDSILKTQICTEFQFFHCIEDCKIKLNSDTLVIKFLNQTTSTYDDIKIKIFRSKISIDYQTLYPVLDPDGKKFWIPQDEKVILNSDDFRIGREIKGILIVKFQEIYLAKNGTKQETNKIEFKGQFKSIIK